MVDFCWGHLMLTNLYKCWTLCIIRLHISFGDICDFLTFAAPTSHIIAGRVIFNVFIPFNLSKVISV